MIFYRKPEPIKAITFDLDDTLYDNHAFIVAAEKAMLQHLEQRFPDFVAMGKPVWRQLRRQAIAQDPRLASDMIQLRKRVLTLLLEELQVEPALVADEVEAAYQVFYQLRSAFTVEERYLRLLAALADRVPLVAITNGNVDLAKVGIDTYFSHVYHASIEMPMKPDPHMFLAAQKALGLPAQHTMHVGDNIEKDVWGALKVGMQAAWYAENRKMNLAKEPGLLLPTVQLHALDELLALV